MKLIKEAEFLQRPENPERAGVQAVVETESSLSPSRVGRQENKREFPHVSLNYAGRLLRPPPRPRRRERQHHRLESCVIEEFRPLLCGAERADHER